MRVFAGPNGSGKSTIFDQIDRKFDIGYYINPGGKEVTVRSEYLPEWVNEYLLR